MSIFDINPWTTPGYQQDSPITGGYSGPGPEGYGAYDPTGGFTPANTGTVLGTSQAPTPSGGGAQAGGGEQQQGAPMEQPQAQPQIDWNAIYAPAIAAYQNLMDVTQNQLPGMLAEITGETGAQVGGLQRELATRTGEYGQQATTATGEAAAFAGEQTGQAKSAISEARRQASELQQGIQARFGGTTGTGGFVSEQLGAQAMRNIGQTRQGLQQVLAKSSIALKDTLGQIERATSQLQTQVAGQIADIESRATVLKQQARDTLNQRVAEIGARMGETETAKAQARQSEMSNYQSYVQDVNTRNTSFKQQLYVQAQQGQQALSKLAAQAQDEYKINLPGGQQISPADFQKVMGGITTGGFEMPAANMEAMFPWARGIKRTEEGEEENLPDYLRGL